MDWKMIRKGLSLLSGARDRSAARAAGTRAMFHEPAEFPFIAPLEANWQAIRDEAALLRPEAYQPWPERNLYGEGWSVFGFRYFGKRFDENCRACPVTAAQPTSGGTAPAAPPITMFCGVDRFSQIV